MRRPPRDCACCRAHSRAFFGAFLSEHQFALFAVLFDKGVVGIEGEKSGVVNIPDKRVKLPQLPTIDLKNLPPPFDWLD